MIELLSSSQETFHPHAVPSFMGTILKYMYVSQALFFTTQLGWLWVSLRDLVATLQDNSQHQHIVIITTSSCIALQMLR